MPLPDTVIFDVPNLIALGAFIAAAWAALAASTSAKAAKEQAEAAKGTLIEAQEQSALAKDAISEAKSQNRIALHNEKLRIYKALDLFKRQVFREGIHYKEEHLWNLYEEIKLAEFYFPPSLNQELKAIVDLAFEIQMSRSRWTEETLPPAIERAELVAKTYQLRDAFQKRVDAIDVALREDLRLVSN